MDTLSPVAVLCCSPKSTYKSLPGVECYDRARDVRTFAGGMPVVCHPPCRAWSAFCAHQAKPATGEKELGPLCAHWLRECGGVLEHPANSRLWSACGLPLPGKTAGDLWSIEVLQSWWDDTATIKRTWLCFSKVPPSDVRISLRLRSPGGDDRRWQMQSRQRRSKTYPNFAAWLVETARCHAAAEELTETIAELSHGGDKKQ